jgi:hypothetical protein
MPAKTTRRRNDALHTITQVQPSITQSHLFAATNTFKAPIFRRASHPREACLPRAATFAARDTDNPSDKPSASAHLKRKVPADADRN